MLPVDNFVQGSQLNIEILEKLWYVVLLIVVDWLDSSNYIMVII